MISVVLVMLFQAAAGEPANSTAPQTTEAAAAPNAGPEQSSTSRSRERVRCRRVQALGTRFAKQRCSTASIDEETAKGARDATMELQRHGAHNLPLTKD